MIRIVVACDADDVIGATDPDVNAARFELVPASLDTVMRELYKAPAIAGGAAMVARFISEGTKTTAFTTDPHWTWPGSESVATVADAEAWARTAAHTAEETVIVGGLRMFSLMTPYARHLDRVVTSRRIPGDLIYDLWRSFDFGLDSKDDFEGGVVEHRSRIVQVPE